MERCRKCSKQSRKKIWQFIRTPTIKCKSLHIYLFGKFWAKNLCPKCFQRKPLCLQFQIHFFFRPICVCCVLGMLWTENLTTQIPMFTSTFITMQLFVMQPVIRTSYRAAFIVGRTEGEAEHKRACLYH